MKRSIHLVLALTALFSGTLMGAPLSNGGFESGILTPWTNAGPVSVSTANPNEGTYHALIQTTQFQTTSQVNLESFLELQSGSLNAFHTGSTNPGGTAMLQMPITVAAGNTISFKWNFLPNGLTSFPSQNDVAFYTLHLDGVSGTAADVFTLSSTILSGGSETGYQTVTTAPLPPGDYVLGFGLYDNGEASGPGGNFFRPDLQIDAVTAIPEPSSLALTALGVLTGAGWFAQRRRR